MGIARRVGGTGPNARAGPPRVESASAMATRGRTDLAAVRHRRAAGDAESRQRGYWQIALQDGEEDSDQDSECKLPEAQRRHGAHLSVMGCHGREVGFARCLKPGPP